MILFTTISNYECSHLGYIHLIMYTGQQPQEPSPMEVEVVVSPLLGGLVRDIIGHKVAVLTRREVRAGWVGNVLIWHILSTDGEWRRDATSPVPQSVNLVLVLYPFSQQIVGHDPLKK